MTERNAPQITIEQLTELLKVHAELISATSEKMAQAITACIQDIQQIGADDEGRTSPELKAQLSVLLSSLQFQDVMRQQVEVLGLGLDTIKQAHVPQAEGQEDWIAESFAKIAASYVMKEQFDAHAGFVAPAGEDVHSDDDMVLF